MCYRTLSLRGTQPLPTWRWSRFSNHLLMFVSSSIHTYKHIYYTYMMHVHRLQKSMMYLKNNSLFQRAIADRDATVADLEVGLADNYQYIHTYMHISYCTFGSLVWSFDYPLTILLLQTQSTRAAKDSNILQLQAIVSDREAAADALQVRANPLSSTM